MREIPFALGHIGAMHALVQVFVNDCWEVLKDDMPLVTLEAADHAQLKNICDVTKVGVSLSHDGSRHHFHP
jgi:hypothetical protein